MSADLVAFLRARLDEDQEAALALEGVTWTAAIDVGDYANTSVVTATPPAKLMRLDGGALAIAGDPVVALCGRDYDGGEERAEHIARHDPARVLAEVASKRALLDLHHDDHGSCSTCGTAGEYDVPWPCTTLELLALPYADHPDYRREWAAP